MTENAHAKLIKKYMQEMSKPHARVVPWRDWLQTSKLPAGLLAAGLGVAACGFETSESPVSSGDDGAAAFAQQAVDSQQSNDAAESVPLIPAPLYGVPICFDGLDNEPNGAVDCDDKYCAQFPGCNGAKYLAPPPECTDRLDNEPNRLVDSQDPYCRGDVCADKLDNEPNGASDCDDPWCDDAPNCMYTEYGAPFPRKPECENKLDDEPNRLIDKQDPFCGGNVCADKLDNEPNGATDCEDKYCAQFPGCSGALYLAPPPICRDGLDNEPNGRIDREDPFCPGIRYGIPGPADTLGSVK